MDAVTIARFLFVWLGMAHAFRDHFMKRVHNSQRDFLVPPWSRDYWCNSWRWKYDERTLEYDRLVDSWPGHNEKIPAQKVRLFYDDLPAPIRWFVEQLLTMVSDGVHLVSSVRAGVFAFAFGWAFNHWTPLDTFYTTDWRIWSIELAVLYSIGFVTLWGPGEYLLRLIPEPYWTKERS